MDDQYRGSLTVRTDTRWHANAPGSATGSLGAITVNDGDVFIDGTKVRWLAITGGSGTAPIGTIVSQGAVSGYFLGFWSSLTAYPSTTIGATGFIKFREVTGGTFTAGALSGITATSAGPDVPGWIEVLVDQAVNITVPRLGGYTARGDWFELGTTTGVVGQVVQSPTMNGGVGTHLPAVWIESGVGTGEYEMYPSLNTGTNGWSRRDLSGPASEQDARQKFVGSLGSGQVQIGTTHTQTGTYANTAEQTGTYSSVATTGTYTWVDGVVTVYISGGHSLRTTDQTGLDFTSGSAADGIFTVTVLDAYYFTVPLAGSGAGGNVTSRPGIILNFTANANNIGFQLLVDFTTGTGVDGTYEVFNNSPNLCWVKYPHTAALTGGNYTAYKGVTLTAPAVHDLSVGNRVDITFDTGTGISGIYTVETVPTTTTFTINMPANVTAGNWTCNRQTGFVPPAGCRIRIPNIIGHQCASGTRSNNATPHGTLTTRTEFVTTSAGYVDVENVIADWYYNFSQAYYVRMKNVATFDQVGISECATAFEMDNVCIGQYAALDAVVLNLVSNFAGGSVGYVRAHRGNAPGSSDHAVSLSYCNNITIDGLDCGIIQYPRSSGKPININACNDIVVEDISVYNGHLFGSTTSRLTINHIDICDRYVGYTNLTSPLYGIEISSCNDVTISSVTYGKNFTIPNCHPVNGILLPNGCNRVKLRNCGTYASPMPTGSWGANTFSMARISGTSGNNNTVKIQEIYVDALSTDWCATVNRDKNILIENVHCSAPNWTSGKTAIAKAIGFLNSTCKNVPGDQTLTGQASVYGTHWENFFNRGGYGTLSFCMNEPTPETAAYVTVASGTAKFNSAGGVILPGIGTQLILETSDWIRGTTFRHTAALMTGGTIGNYTLTYAINTGAGYGAFKSLTGANLSAEVIPATGFKMKLSIQTTIANTAAITFLRLLTFNDPVVNAANPYPLDTTTLTLSGLQAGSDVVVLQAGTETVLVSEEDYAGTSWGYQYETAQPVDIGVFKQGYFPQYIRNYLLGTANASLPITQTPDPSYLG